MVENGTFIKLKTMFLHIRKFRKKVFAVSFVFRKQKAGSANSFYTRKIVLNSINNYQQNILFCIRLRFSFRMLKNYTVPMQNFSSLPKKTDSNSEKTRLENRLQIQPTAATLQKIVQFASTYRAERINENQYVEWVLN